LLTQERLLFREDVLLNMIYRQESYSYYGGYTRSGIQLADRPDGQLEPRQYIVGYADERLNILRLGTVDTYFETMRVSGRWSNSRYQSTTSKLTSFPSLPGAFPVWHYLSRCFPISM